ncbi:MAG: CopG family transcriptional regulator [Spirochaetes bacterium GWB1_48_6]|nr:MAG: CopG family transcriptional regulator [Spirochaetes bacterium GWB1_48_6]
MEKRLGVIAIILSELENVNRMNSILSEHGDLVVGRMGLPMRGRQLHVISLIVEGTTDEIGALTGKLGRLGGVQVKSMLTKQEAPHAGDR